MASSDDDDEETFVRIGNPLKPYEEDEVIKKQFDLQNQKVKDDKGRQRFHGAFTGGFSAGYFNTVGSKEGWTPSVFVSSRQQRAENVRTRPEDFMDSEDLGEFGIAPRSVQASTEYSSADRLNRKRTAVTDGIIPGTAPLADLVKPASLRIGVKLLRRLGWKDGQGIGQRVRKRLKGSGKTYSCSLPGKASEQSGSESDADISSISQVTFAPKDVAPVTFTPKDNLHGLGYSGISIGGAFNRQEFEFRTGPSQGRTTKKGIRGQAFGVGALEDDDDGDVYDVGTDLSQYDMVLGGPDTTGTHGWTAPSHKELFRADSILEGFSRMSTQPPHKVFPPPDLPREYRPYHIFSAEENASSNAAAEIPKKFSMSYKNMDVSERRDALGEKPEIKSVFDLVSEKDKRHMTACQMEPQKPMVKNDHITAAATSEKAEKIKSALLAGLTNRFQSGGTEIQTLPGLKPAESTESTPGENKALYSNRGVFKPFASDEAKQARYEKFLEAKKHGQEDVHDEKLTEWEQSHEREEFTRAMSLYRPMSNVMATRFTQAQFAEDAPAVKEVGLSDMEKAASMKMYGRMTREVHRWFPDKLLCKRFNVPDPYPESTMVGMPKVRKEKFSVFNLLSFPGEDGRETDQLLVDKQPADDSATVEKDLQRSHRKHQQGKPLAILATLDLRRPSQKTDTKPTVETEELTTDEPTSTENLVSDRPPMDVFRAVFGDSSSAESSSDDDNDDDNKNESQGAASSATVHVNPLPQRDNYNLTNVHGVELEETIIKGVSISVSKSNVSDSDKQYINSWDCDSVRSDDNVSEEFNRNQEARNEDNGMERLSVTRESDDVELNNLYGPPLPPQLLTGRAPPQNIINLDKNSSIKSKKKKKHKDKEKHKHKKKKSKQKKHKKKKKSSKTVVISDSSGSEADIGTPDSMANSSPGTPDSENERVTTALLERLRGESSKRPSAADFM